MLYHPEKTNDIDVVISRYVQNMEFDNFFKNEYKNEIVLSNYIVTILSANIFTPKHKQCLLNAIVMGIYNKIGNITKLVDYFFTHNKNKQLLLEEIFDYVNNFPKNKSNFKQIRCNVLTYLFNSSNVIEIMKTFKEFKSELEYENKGIFQRAIDKNIILDTIDNIELIKYMNNILTMKNYTCDYFVHLFEILIPLTKKYLFKHNSSKDMHLILYKLNLIVISKIIDYNIKIHTLYIFLFYKKYLNNNLYENVELNKNEQTCKHTTCRYIGYWLKESINKFDMLLKNNKINTDEMSDFVKNIFKISDDDITLIKGKIDVIIFMHYDKILSNLKLNTSEFRTNYFRFIGDINLVKIFDDTVYDSFNNIWLVYDYRILNVIVQAICRIVQELTYDNVIIQDYDIYNCMYNLLSYVDIKIFDNLLKIEDRYTVNSYCDTIYIIYLTYNKIFNSNPKSLLDRKWQQCNIILNDAIDNFNQNNINNLIKQRKEKIKNKYILNDDITNDEFLDPLSCNLIIYPIKIPKCDDIFDKATIMYHIYETKYITGESTHPYTREKLTMDDIEAYNKNDDIVKEIAQFNTKLDSLYK
jgi:hypothetical protein